MGDEDWIRSASSLRFLREEIKPGDLILCYETDRKQLVGLPRAASDDRDARMGSLIDCCSPHQSVRLENPLRRKPDLDHILAFTPQRGRGTVREVDRDEFARLRRLIQRKNPSQTKALRCLMNRTAAKRTWKTF